MILFGALAILLGLNSCDNDDEPGLECFVGILNGDRRAWCWDGSLTYYDLSSGREDKTRWQSPDNQAAWEDIKRLTTDIGATCD